MEDLPQKAKYSLHYLGYTVIWVLVLEMFLIKPVVKKGGGFSLPQLAN
jgi:hypothetical protein